MQTLCLAFICSIASTAIGQTLLRELPRLPLPGPALTANSIALGDFNGDGALDLFVGARNDRQIDLNQLYINRGDGFFVNLSASHLPSVSPYPYFWATRQPDTSHGIAVGDVDGDEDVDILIANDMLYGMYGKPDSLLYLNNGFGIFKDVTSPRLPYSDKLAEFKHFRAWSTAMGDLDSDGDNDLVLGVPHGGGEGVVVLANDGKGFFAYTQLLATWHIPYSSRVHTVQIADFNGDGLRDIFFGCSEIANLVHSCGLFINDGNGRFRDTSSSAFGQVPSFPEGWHSAVGDIDRDGDVDILIVDGASAPAPGLTHVLINDGKGVFTRENQRLPQRVGDRHVKLTLADFDGDGDLDLFTGDFVDARPNAECRIWENDGKGYFIDRRGTWFPNQVSSHVYASAAGDIDQDGDVDLIAGRFNDGKFQHHMVFFNHTRQLYAPSAPQLGKPYRLDLSGRPNELAILLMSFAYLRQNLGVFGELGLDMNQGFLWPVPLMLNSQGQTAWTIPIPYMPSLLHCVLCSQAFHVDPSNAFPSRLGNVMIDQIQ